jgi:hypothetical protein
MSDNVVSLPPVDRQFSGRQRSLRFLPPPASRRARLEVPLDGGDDELALVVATLAADVAWIHRAVLDQRLRRPPGGIVSAGQLDLLRSMLRSMLGQAGRHLDHTARACRQAIKSTG